MTICALEIYNYFYLLTYKAAEVPPQYYSLRSVSIPVLAFGCDFWCRGVESCGQLRRRLVHWICRNIWVMADAGAQILQGGPKK